MRRLLEMFGRLIRSFWDIEKRIVDGYEGYDKETNWED